jgi:2-oxoglutarate ferredoxin oxidoreductase subunit alpha
VKTDEIPRSVLTGEHFISGDVAIAEGALAGGCTFFAGYPITPSTEIAERFSRRFEKAEGVYLQMEDEIASMCAILGASWGGRRAMTATSGPGFSLMMENLGLAVMTETPCVVANVQRGGPSTGLPTLVGQQDMMQARWGSHGDYALVAYVPSSPQEAFQYTFKAFNIAERYRIPVLIMADEAVGHMTEKVVIPRPEALPLEDRPRPTVPPGKFLPFEPGGDLVPPMACAGEGYRIHVTGLTHDERGYPVLDSPTQERLVRRLVDKIRLNADRIVEYEEKMMEDAEICVVSYGISARVAMEAVSRARRRGIKAGLFRLITAWPFPEGRVEEIAARVKKLVVVEINLGQMMHEVERCGRGKAPVILVGNAGGALHTPEEILDVLEKEASR